MTPPPLFAPGARNAPVSVSVWTAAGVSHTRCALVWFGVWEAARALSSVSPCGWRGALLERILARFLVAVFGPMWYALCYKTNSGLARTRQQ